MLVDNLPAPELYQQDTGLFVGRYHSYSLGDRFKLRPLKPVKIDEHHRFGDAVYASRPYSHPAVYDNVEQMLYVLINCKEYY